MTSGVISGCDAGCLGHPTVLLSTAVERLSLRLLGGFHLSTVSGTEVEVPRRKVQALLAYLACPPGQVHPRDKLAALLWPDASAGHARQNLRQVLTLVRRALAVAPSALHVTEAVAALDPAAIDVDVAEFQRLAVATAPAALDAAAALYRGDLLAGLAVDTPPFEEWLLAERERLRELALEALARLLAHQRQVGQIDAAVQTALRLIALDPLQEAVHRTLMRLYATQERRDAALRQYQICLDVLRRDLGVEPEGATQQLYQEILRQRPLAAPEAGGSRLDNRPASVARRFRSYVPAVATRLAGRKAEMTRLRAVLADAINGHGRVVAVLGEAGIGKTRLVAELATEALATRARVLRGLAAEGEKILPFGPWLDALRSSHMAEDDDIIGAFDPLWKAELARLMPELGPPSSTPAEPNRLFESFARLLQHVATSAPLVVVLEDVHWADDMSLRLLAFLGRRREAWPGLIVVTAREEELADVPALGTLLRDLAREKHLGQLTVGALSRDETETLVKTLVPAHHDRARLSARVWEASEGHPFVAVETLRALDEAARMPEPESLGRSERIRETVTARLDRLDGASRQLAALAAVIGGEFDFALVQRMSGLDEREAAEGLERLVRRRVLRVTGERFALAHDWIRAVAYEQILPPIRTALHAVAARAIVALYGDLESRWATLAIHHRESAAWADALRCFRTAGRQAAARAAHREAVQCFEQALGALEHLAPGPELSAEAVDLRFDLRNSLVPLGAGADVNRRLREAHTIAADIGDRRRLGWVASYTAFQSNLAAEYPSAEEAGQRALATAGETDDLKLRIHANYCLAITYYSLGEHRRAVDAGRAALELLGDRPGEVGGGATLPGVVCRSYLAFSLAELGRFHESRAVLEEAVRIAEIVDHRYSAAFAAYGTGLVRVLQGQAEAAVADFERSLALCRAGEFHVLEPFLAAGLGMATVRAGQVDDGLRVLEEAVASAAARGHHLWAEQRTLWFAEGCLAAGRRKDAGEHALRTLTAARDHATRGVEAWTLRLLGRLAAARDDMAESQRCFQEALALAMTLGMRPLQAHCYLDLGRLGVQRNSPAEAREALGAAAAIFEVLEMSAGLREAETALDDLPPAISN